MKRPHHSLSGIAYQSANCAAGGLSRLAKHGANLLLDGNPILLVWDEPMEGVGRPWFECPVCHRRCRHLYLRQLACRRCCRLDYSSRHLRRQTPGVGRIERLRHKLGSGCDARPFAPLPRRPPGLSKACHERLVAMIQDEEAKLVELLGGIVHDLRRRIQVRKTKHRW